MDFGVRGEPPCLGAPDRGAAHDAAADRRVARCPPRQVSCCPQPAPRRCGHIECVPVVGALPARVCALDESLQRCPLLASRRRVGAPPALDPDGCCDQLAGMRASGCCQRGVPAPFRRRERYACDLASRGGLRGCDVATRGCEKPQRTRRHRRRPALHRASRCACAGHGSRPACDPGFRLLRFDSLHTVLRCRPQQSRRSRGCRRRRACTTRPAKRTTAVWA